MAASIRPATRDDYRALTALYDEVDAAHRDQLPQIFRKPDGAAREPDYYLGLLADENVRLFVAEVDGELVGFVHAFGRTAPDVPVLIPSRYVVVDGIVVSAAYQNQGIGALLMEQVQEWARANGAAAIELNVYDFNESAIAVYERLGYRTLSRKMRKELPLEDSLD